MPIELHILSGSRAGERPVFDKSIIAIGRHPACDLQFDPNEELVVSARHAEIVTVGRRTTVRDVGSSNGTFVNGQRVAGEMLLADGDEILLGKDGPRLTIRLVRPVPVVVPAHKSSGSAGARGPASEFDPTRRLRYTLGAMILVLGGGLASAYWLGQRTLAQATATRTDTPETPVQQGASLTSLELSEISARNDAGVAFLATELDGKPYGSTAFGITPEGLLVTNRHNVRSETGQPPTRMLVKYANTARYLPARVVSVSADDSVDLALLQVEGAGPFPTVSGIARSSSALVAGEPVVTIGFPHSLQTPQEGDTLKTSLFAGTVSKRVTRLLQIDAYAGHGSSGTPIFDKRGLVVGVVWGGDPDSNGRITYAAPSEGIVGLLPATARGIVK